MKKLLFLLSIGFFLPNILANDFRNVPLNRSITEAAPFKGIVLWAGNEKMSALQNSISLEFLYYQPCKVVTGKQGGVLQYDWSSFDAALDAAASRGHQTIVRFYFEYPGTAGTITGAPHCTCNVAGATAVPLYIKNGNYGYSETYEANNGQFDGGQVYYADWSNAELQWFVKQFYTDLTARYDNDPRIAYIQVGFGYWGEYHIYGAANTTLGVNFPSKTYQAEFLEHIATLFKETPWSVSKDISDEDISPVYGNAILMNLNFGIFDDSFMHETHDLPAGCTVPWQCAACSNNCGWNQYHINRLSTTRWETAPFGGEISYYTADDQKNFLNPAGMYGTTFEERVAQYHVSYMCGNDATTGNYATASRLLEANIASGYKFEIVAYQVSGTEAKVSVKNIGVAPLYHNAYITVNGVRSAVSLKGLLPGAVQEYSVTGLSVGSNETPELTITSDKILLGKTIPYQANLTGTTSTPQITQEQAFITQTGNKLTFAGEKYSVDIINLQGQILLSTSERSIDISSLSTSCYIVSYLSDNGYREVKRIVKQ